ncbi:MAG: energy transducer TonB [Acidobacteriota bacterium]|jgi:protein TonB|nr:energy transducer TonB [Acidobacteriota bacterium]
MLGDKTLQPGDAKHRLLFAAGVSALSHAILAACLLLPSPAGGKETARAWVRPAPLEMERAPMEEPAPPSAPMPAPAPAADRKDPEKPPALDLTEAVAPVPLETAKRLEGKIAAADIFRTPAPPAPEPITMPDGGIGSGADANPGDGGTPPAAGTDRGRGVEIPGDGRGADGGTLGSGGGTGGGTGSGSGNDRGRAGADGDGGIGYFAGRPGVVPPEYDRTPQPTYPEASRRRGEAGKVLLRVQVLENGRVGELGLAASSGYGILDEAALRAVKHWRFKPARKGKTAVICWVNIPVEFQLH